MLAEYTLPFNEADVTYFPPLYIQTVAHLGFFPLNITADAASLCLVDVSDLCFPWRHRCYRPQPARPSHFCLRPRWRVPLSCRPAHAADLSVPAYQGLQRSRCPLLFPQPTGQSCQHEQFLKEKGCVKDIDIEAGGLMRVMLDRDGPLYKGIYRQRTCAERINSQAQADAPLSDPKCAVGPQWLASIRSSISSSTPKRSSGHGLSMPRCSPSSPWQSSSPGGNRVCYLLSSALPVGRSAEARMPSMRWKARSSPLTHLCAGSVRLPVPFGSFIPCLQ